MDSKKKISSIVSVETEMESLYKAHLEYIKSKTFSEETLRGQKYNMLYFISWCKERGITRPQVVTSEVLDRYRQHVSKQKTRKGTRLAAKTQFARLVCLRTYFRWLKKKGKILYNPALEMELPRLGKPLPKCILSVQEVEKIMSQPEISNPVGIRDRAILEVLYSTGIRRAELMNLKIGDIDKEKGIVIINEGKGKKSRIVPIGERAVMWTERYITEVRPNLSSSIQEEYLFLNQAGTRIKRTSLATLVCDYIRFADIGKKGGCHIFRHTMATLMLENGADIRYIQEILGHESLKATQIYTRVSIKKLKEVHDRTHPGARMEREE